MASGARGSDRQDDEEKLRRILLTLVAFAAGTLLGGAFFHLLPAAVSTMGGSSTTFLWVLVGFTSFFILEQFLHWHHAHRPADMHVEPLTWLVLIGDGLHNLLGGLAVAGAFLVDIRTGILTWLAAAAHEVPQELGDFAVLVHGGWPRRRALLLNFASALTFPLGGIVAWIASLSADVTFLLPRAAGNFIYIAATDLVPEITRHREPGRYFHFLAFASGIVLLYLLAALVG